MPSPFPGMDPYLERRDYWQAAHTALLVYLQDALSPLVEPRYVVDLESRRLVDWSGDDRPFSGTIGQPKPVRRWRRWLTIRNLAGRKVVTVIELLSPLDKRPGKDRVRYLDKRARVLGSSANLVEIDLLRGGERMPVDGLPACDYCVVVSRRRERPAAGVWPVGVRDPLPAVPVPLAPGEAEPLVPLRPVLDRVYDGGGYRYKVYDRPPDPPLAGPDADWAAGLVPAG